MAQEKLNNMKEDLMRYFFKMDYNSVEVKQLLESYLEDMGNYPLESLYEIGIRQRFH